MMLAIFMSACGGGESNSHPGGGGNSPTEPSNPADPTNPTDPTSPVDPTEPTDPTNPSTPTKVTYQYKAVDYNMYGSCEEHLEIMKTQGKDGYVLSVPMPNGGIDRVYADRYLKPEILIFVKDEDTSYSYELTSDTMGMWENTSALFEILSHYGSSGYTLMSGLDSFATDGTPVKSCNFWGKNNNNPVFTEYKMAPMVNNGFELMAQMKELATQGYLSFYTHSEISRSTPGITGNIYYKTPATAKGDYDFTTKKYGGLGVLTRFLTMGNEMGENGWSEVTSAFEYGNEWYYIMVKDKARNIKHRCGTHEPDYTSIQMFIDQANAAGKEGKMTLVQMEIDHQVSIPLSILAKSMWMQTQECNGNTCVAIDDNY